MPKRHSSLALLCLTSILASSSFGQGITIIDPNKKTKSASPAARDTEHFEIGAYTGMLSVEDFNTNPVFGIALRYYVNEKAYIEGNIGSSETKRANSEDGLDFNPERDFSYVTVAGGYQILKGRAFWGKKRKYNSGLYLVGGLEQVDFADNSETGAVIGVSYKTLLTDAFTFNIDFRDHIVNQKLENVSNDSKMTHNIELAIGFNLFF